jgi:acetyl esterase/lipase
VLAGCCLFWHAVRLVRQDAEARGFDPEKIGAYNGNNPDGFEVAPARRYLNEKGMTVVTIKYRTPRPKGGLAKHTTAWQDLQRAIRVVRSQAAAEGLDSKRIGIMGSSAGGHLTLMGVTSSKQRSYWPIADLHTLVKRGHCFQKKAALGTGSYTWMDRIWEFMNHKGYNQ